MRSAETACGSDRPALDMSVIIPTYNRRTILLQTLEALERQTLTRARYEIIVVDDASTDGTVAAVENLRGVRLFKQPENSGPAAARNVGIRAAAGGLVLFLGDDTIARPELLEQHIAAHSVVPGDHVAVLGYASWASGTEVTPLMRYIERGRAFPQFNYDAIRDSDNVAYEFFYTCNLSLSRQFLLTHGVFDEEFRHAYQEDTELAYRLQCHGLRTVFRRELVVDHYHPTSYRSAKRRTRIAGEVALLAARKHPEWVDLSFLNYGPKRRLVNWLKRRTTEGMLDPLLELADRRRWDYRWLAFAYGWCLRKHQFWGLVDAVAAEGAPRAAPSGRTTTRNT